MAKAEQLEPFSNLSLIDSYAQRYGRLPREVAQEPFEEVIPYIVMWQKQADYYDRYEAAKKFINGNGNTKN